MEIKIDPMTNAVIVMAIIVAVLFILGFLADREEKRTKTLHKHA